jgi:adenylate cyclase
MRNNRNVWGIAAAAAGVALVIAGAGFVLWQPPPPARSPAPPPVVAQSTPAPAPPASPAAPPSPVQVQPLAQPQPPAAAPPPGQLEAAATLSPDPAMPVVRQPPKTFSVLVMPFTNLGADPQQQYFSDAIAEDITTELSRIDNSFVIDRDTAFSFRGRPYDPREIGKDLGVRFVLEGSVWRIGEFLKVTVLLADNETQVDLWSEYYQFHANLVGQLADTVATRMAQALRLNIAATPIGQAASEPVKRARAQTIAGGVQTRENYRTARDLFEQALRDTPDSVPAQTWLARVLTTMLVNGWSEAPDADRARALSLLDGLQRSGATSVDQHVARGILHRLQAQLDDAVKQQELAIALDGNEPAAYSELGTNLVLLGRPQDGLPHLEKALRLNPVGSFRAAQYRALGHAQALAGRADEAVTMLKRARAADEELWSVAFDLAAALGMRGDVDEGKAVLADAKRLNPALTSIAAHAALEPGASSAPYKALRDTTLNAGLRKLGFPDQ